MKDKDVENPRFRKTDDGTGMVVQQVGEGKNLLFRCRVERLAEDCVIFDLLTTRARVVVALTSDEFLAVSALMAAYQPVVGEVEEIHADASVN